MAKTIEATPSEVPHIGSLPPAFSAEELSEDPGTRAQPTDEQLASQYDYEEAGTPAEPAVPAESAEPTEPAQAPAEKPTAESAPADASLELGPETRELAKMLNVSEQELASFTNPADAQRALLFLATRQQAALPVAPQQVQQQPIQTPMPPQAPQAAPVATPAQPTTQVPAEQQFKKYELKLNDEYLDEETRQQIAGMNDHYHAEVERARLENAQLRNAVGQLVVQQQQIASQVQAASEAQFDSWFDSLGSEWEPIFGKGVPDVGTPAHKNRDRVWGQVQQIRMTCALTGHPAPRPQELFKRAMTTVFPEKTETMVRRKINERVRNQAGQFMAQPGTGTNGSGPTGREKAIHNISRILRSAGFADYEEEPDPEL